MKLSETVCGLTLGDNNVSGVADSTEIATGRLGAASCYQIITSSTSDAVKKSQCPICDPQMSMVMGY